jgi:hypothetical protein
VLAGFETWCPFFNLSGAHFAVEGLSRVAKVSNFEQTATAKKRMRNWDVGARDSAHVDNRSVLAIR